VTITVWSDYACPFAFLGYRRLLVARPDPSTVTWQPFELHPEIPFGGVPRPRGGGGSLRALIEAEGVRLRASERVWNSRAALQAAEIARAEERFDALHARLFAGAWEEGLDLGRPDVLRAVVADVGLDADAVIDAIRAGVGVDAIVESIEDAFALGITGTPSYLLDGRVLRGVQEIDDLRER
jgi:predicted DsbA family dithiol-disulfide isomerase